MSPRGPSNKVVAQLMAELGRAFDQSKPLGDRTLGDAVEERIRALRVDDEPDWGTDGSPIQLARHESSALDFYYRPHLFPEMDPALCLGHLLQFDLLPRTLDPRSPLKIATVLESFCHLSGDLLGWRMEGDELFLWIADVSGHGVRSGLAAATLYFLIGSIEEGLSPARFAERVNGAMLEARNPADRRALFATAVWVRAGADGRLRYASSGHNPMLLFRSGGGVDSLDSTGRPLGLLPGSTFGDVDLVLDPEDALCLYTDGLVEARDPDDEEFGPERLAEVGVRGSGAPMRRTAAIYQALQQHQGTRLIDDDLTFMIAQRADPC